MTVRHIQTISILGCGWLGKALAKHLISNGYKVNGSTPNVADHQELVSQQITPFAIQLNENEFTCNDLSFFDADALVVMVPPRRKAGNTANYATYMSGLLSVLNQSKLKKIVFISSTSVYPETGTLVTESDAIPDQERGLRMLEAEQEIAKTNKAVVILRMAGLTGPGRVPGAARREIIKKNAPVNFIHQYDAVRIIEEVIEKTEGNQIYNVCCTEHPLRKDLYQKISDMGFHVSIKVTDEHDPNRKMVDNSKILTALGYKLKYPDPMLIPREAYE